MDFRFTPQEEAFRQEVRSFIQKELPLNWPGLEESMTDEWWPANMEFRKKLGKKRWIGIGWPKEYGGLGATIIEQVIFHEEMVYHQAPLDPQAYQVGPAIIAHGSEYLKKKFLAATASQEMVWCQGFSEPNAGSDLANIQTRAEEDGDEFVITGTKIWTSHGHRADWIHILTRTDPQAPKHKGISYLVVDMHSPGITILPLINMLGGHGFNMVHFDGVRVPKENIIGEKNMGWYVATTTLDNERSGIRDVSTARRLLDTILRLYRDEALKTRVRRDAVMVHKLAELAIELQAARWLSYRTAWMQSRGMRPNMEASMAKLFASELQQRIARAGMEALGLHGQLLGPDRWTPVRGAIPRDYMRTIPSTIAAGSSEIQRNIMAQRGLGLPR